MVMAMTTGTINTIPPTNMPTIMATPIPTITALATAAVTEVPIDVKAWHRGIEC